jgi:hypothetical protein
MTAATAKDGGGGQQWWQTTKTAMADKHSGGQQRQRTMTPCKIGWQTTRGKEESRRQTTTALGKKLNSQGRECEKIKILFTQKDFFQKYGPSGWIFCSRKNSQCALLILSVLNAHRLVMLLRSNSVFYKKNSNWQSQGDVECDSTCPDNHRFL